MKKILFLIHDLGHGGAEKVLVNLVNNMNRTKFDITVMTLFDEGVNKQFLLPHIHYKTCFSKAIPGNSHLMKLLTPRQLHRWLIREQYDVEVSYLEGPSARIISGCQDSSTKLVSWIHIEQHTAQRAAASFRSIKEAKECYGEFCKIISVSKTVEDAFRKSLQVDVPYEVIYNTNESETIRRLAQEPVEVMLRDDQIKLVGVGKLLKSKGFARILRITKQLVEKGYPVHTYILGEGPERENLQRYIDNNGLKEHSTLLGYQLNPYKYVSKCDLFVCASYAEGFSTAATEALIVGTPVCTVEVSGMRELLGEHNEYGIVTQNDEQALYQGLHGILDNPALLEDYKKRAIERGKEFNTEKTVQAVEKMLINL